MRRRPAESSPRCDGSSAATILFPGHVIDREETPRAPQAQHVGNRTARAVQVNEDNGVEMTLEEHQIRKHVPDVLVTVDLAGCEIVELGDIGWRPLVRGRGRPGVEGWIEIDDMLAFRREHQRRESPAVE